MVKVLYVSTWTIYSYMNYSFRPWFQKRVKLWALFQGRRQSPVFLILFILVLCFIIFYCSSWHPASCRSSKICFNYNLTLKTWNKTRQLRRSKKIIVHSQVGLRPRRGRLIVDMYLFLSILEHIPLVLFLTNVDQTVTVRWIISEKQSTETNKQTIKTKKLYSLCATCMGKIK